MKDVKELDATELQAFLAGDDTYLDPNEPIYGTQLFFDVAGPTFGADPFWWNRRSEISDGRIVVKSRWRGTVAEFPLREVSCVVKLRLKPGSWDPGIPGCTWLVGEGGRPLAGVPWGGTVHRQAKEIGLRVRAVRGYANKAAFETLRPESAGS